MGRQFRHARGSFRRRPMVGSYRQPRSSKRRSRKVGRWSRERPIPPACSGDLLKCKHDDGATNIEGLLWVNSGLVPKSNLRSPPKNGLKSDIAAGGPVRAKKGTLAS